MEARVRRRGTCTPPHRLRRPDDDDSRGTRACRVAGPGEAKHGTPTCESACHAVRCAPRPAAASGERVAFSQVVRDELRCVAKRAVRGGWYQRGHSKGILPVAATI